MTSPDFPFVKGDKIRAIRWADRDAHIDITALGRDGFLADLNGMEVWYRYTEHDWERYVEPPVRKRWIVETEEKVPNAGAAVVLAFPGGDYRIDTLLHNEVALSAAAKAPHRVIVSVEPAE